MKKDRFIRINRPRRHYAGLGVFLCLVLSAFAGQRGLVLNEQGVFEMTGLDVAVFLDAYPEGHQGGVTIIQNGVRVAANGDLRLEPAPGQWQPVPKVVDRKVDKEHFEVSVSCSYPNPDLNRRGFNPIVYPDLSFQYQVRVRAEGASFRIAVDLIEKLPSEWIGKVGFNLELFPGDLFGKTYMLDGRAGIFPRQLNGPMVRDGAGDHEIKPMAEGGTLIVAPENDAQRMTITSCRGSLQLIDGRAHHNNGWFIVRTPVPEGATASAVEWIVSPNVLPDWKYGPVIHLSQVGYHTRQKKTAVIECDPNAGMQGDAALIRIPDSGKTITALSAKPTSWGRFLRYRYLLFDFSGIREQGLYQVTYGGRRSQPFPIGDDVFDRHVWQPTLETFLPVQMCHMRVMDRYRVWHGLCHADDALMAPLDTLHFDGYRQGPSTLTPFKPLERVPGLNSGGWHDAGDDDLRVESQAEEIRTLALIYETFRVDYDETAIDQQNRVVEMHRPDGKPDLQQQIEHGVLSILGGINNLGRPYRGIISSDLRQYVLLGDPSTMTDNLFFDPRLAENERMNDASGKRDDRWVFTEDNPARELLVAACLAAAARALKDYDAGLADECLRKAEAFWEKDKAAVVPSFSMIDASVELLLTTRRTEYRDRLVSMLPAIRDQISRAGWLVGRVLPLLDDDGFRGSVTESVLSYRERLKQDIDKNPFGVPYHPRIWGAGWDIERLGVQHYFLHRAWPEIFSDDAVFNALNFVLGCHPGPNTASFASGVGVRSVTSAYGFNRADESYIPGGVVSGTACIRPDFQELKEWPYLWQQTEYVMGGGASNLMFLVLAAKQLLGGS